ncbi:gamma carbonic anhydrase family protein [Cephaloticoccus primus]|uniref:Gamma carbonic anhydrase family protein n=1 Tax=Cephaloticoccus primus TaxID=1548207 RepID=A0A139SLW5_9BACT|nr:gamma carbonic anhydrase family protein [Cephaloticoccus primus]KXU35546.1 gamma carbonic anhydrase family protein [Cephaloticoccus primus]
MDVNDRLARHLLSREPDTARALFVAPTASIQGDVVLSENSSVFYGAVLRGDIAEIRIGAGTNIQDNAVVHLADDLGAHIGEWCTIGHAAIIHACTIGDECLIGMGATVLDGAVVGERSIVGANSLVPQGMQVPPGSMVYGSPAKVIRPLRAEELAFLKKSADKYIAVARAHAAYQARRRAVPAK